MEANGGIEDESGVGAMTGSCMVGEEGCGGVKGEQHGSGQGIKVLGCSSRRDDEAWVEAA